MVVCVCLAAQSRLTLCDHMDCSPAGSSVHGLFSRQEYWNKLPFSMPGDLPDPEMELMSPASPALGSQILLPLGHLGSPMCGSS